MFHQISKDIQAFCDNFDIQVLIFCPEFWLKIRQTISNNIFKRILVFLNFFFIEYPENSKVALF